MAEKVSALPTVTDSSSLTLYAIQAGVSSKVLTNTPNGIPYLDTNGDLIINGGGTFTGVISASNFSGSSSGTNTGDQNLTPYGQLTAANTWIGNNNFTTIPTINSSDILNAANLNFVNNVQFMTGDGISRVAQLVDANGNVPQAVSVSAIYRSDWQGNQLLYPSARTNLGFSSQLIGDSPWASLGSGSTAFTAVAPDGTTTGALITSTSATVITGYASNAVLVTAGVVYCVSCYFKYTNNQWVVIQERNGASSYVPDLINGVLTGPYNPDNTIVGAGIVAAAQGYWRVWVNFQFPTTSTCQFVLGLASGADNFGGVAVGQSADMWGFQVETVASASATPTPYLVNPSATAAATLTDYTLTGTTVNLAQAPVGPTSPATITWSGSILDSGSLLSSGGTLTGGLSLSQPSLITPVGTSSTTGGTVAAGTYYAKLVALDSNNQPIVGPESIGVVTTGTTSSISWVIRQVVGAASYQLWVGTASGAENTYIAIPAFIAPAYTYTQTAALAAGTPPSSDTFGSLSIAGVLKFTAGVSLATPEEGAVEFDGTNLYFTNASSVRQTLVTLSGATFTGAVTFDSGFSIDNASGYNDPFEISLASTDSNNLIANFGFQTYTGGSTTYNFLGPNVLLTVSNNNDSASCGFFESYDIFQLCYITGGVQNNIFGLNNSGKVGSFVPSTSGNPTWRNLLDDGTGNASFGGVIGGLNVKQIGAPPAPVGTTSTTGGSLAAGTYYACAVLTDGNGGIVVSAESSGVTTTGTTSSILWTLPQTNSYGNYQLWVGTTSGAEDTYVSVGNGNTSYIPYNQTATLTNTGTLPTGNTTGGLTVAGPTILNNPVVLNYASTATAGIEANGFWANFEANPASSSGAGFSAINGQTTYSSAQPLTNNMSGVLGASTQQGAGTINLAVGVAAQVTGVSSGGIVSSAIGVHAQSPFFSSYTGSFTSITGLYVDPQYNATYATNAYGINQTGSLDKNVFAGPTTFNNTIAGTSATFSSTISASNFSGSSSGTNTGDQNLTPYALLAGATFTGAISGTSASFSSTVSMANAQTAESSISSWEATVNGTTYASFLPWTSAGAYSGRVAAGDAALIFGLQSGGTPTTSLVIAPWSSTGNGIIINPDGGLGITSNLATSPGQIALNCNEGEYNVIHRNDNSNYYILVSASTGGSWNSLRPLTIALSSGAVTLDGTGAGGVGCGGPLNTSGLCTLNTGWTGEASGLIIGASPSSGQAGLYINAPSGYTQWLLQLVVGGSIVGHVDYVGNAAFNGTITGTNCIATSDIRFKTDIHDLLLDRSLEFLKLSAKSYIHTITNRPQVGFIASDVRLFEPHMVFEDEDGMLALDYDRVAVFHHVIIQDHETKISHLMNKVAKLEQQLVELGDK